MKLVTRTSLAGAFALAVVGAALFWPLTRCAFTNFDDNVYVLENPRVFSGVRPENVSWAFTAFASGTWQPLTWLSYMLDAELYGADPGGFHRTNLLLHLGSAALLFAGCLSLTGARWRSWTLAALFALHPLHVESVAWVAERKGLLSALFGFAALAAYAAYARRRRGVSYALLLVFYAGSLMAKPMLMTLPFLLLLLDYWPLGRLHPALPGPGGPPRASLLPALGKLVLEKAPLFALAAASMVVTYLAQERGLASVAGLPPGARAGNALSSCVRYLAAALWPHRLAVFYPHPGAGLPAWEAAGAGLALLAVTAAAGWQARRRGWLLAGWLWFLGTLLPVLGIVQTGMHARADRFTYVPLAGASIVALWGSAAALARVRNRERLLAVAAALSLCLFAAISWRQASFWRDSRTLFTRALAVTEGNFVAHNHLGMALHEAGDAAGALAEYARAVETGPGYHYALYNMAMALHRLGRPDEAIGHFRRALALRPDDADALSNLGIALGEAGRHEEALASYRDALRVDAGHVFARNNLASALVRLRRHEEAALEYREALRREPGNAVIHNNLGLVLARLGRHEEAAAHFGRALRLDPGFVDARRNLERLPAAGRPRGPAGLTPP